MKDQKFVRLRRDIKKRMSAKKEPDDIDLTMMLALKSYPPATMDEMAKVSGRTKSTIVQRLKWLEENGYVRIADGMTSIQGRSRILTEKGFMFCGQND